MGNFASWSSDSARYDTDPWLVARRLVVKYGADAVYGWPAVRRYERLRRVPDIPSDSYFDAMRAAENEITERTGATADVASRVMTSAIAERRRRLTRAMDAYSDLVRDDETTATESSRFQKRCGELWYTALRSPERRRRYSL